MAGCRVPLHRRAVTRIDVGFARGDETKLERRSRRHEMLHGIVREIFVGLLVAMRAACNRNQAFFRGRPHRDARGVRVFGRAARLRVDLERARRGLAEEHALLRRRIDHAAHRLAVDDLRDVDREFAVASDEFLGPVEGIDEEETRFDLGHASGCDSFLCDHRHAWRQMMEALQDELLGFFVRGGHGRMIRLLSRHDFLCVVLQDDAARVVRNVRKIENHRRSRMRLDLIVHVNPFPLAVARILSLP